MANLKLSIVLNAKPREQSASRMSADAMYVYHRALLVADNIAAGFIDSKTHSLFKPTLNSLRKKEFVEQRLTVNDMPSQSQHVAYP